MLWTAFIIGLIGSWHCVGMCGPLLMALPDKQAAWPRFLVQRGTYHLARSVSYAGLGLFAGLFGSGLQWIGWQQGLSILSGILVLAWVMVRFFPGKKLSFQLQGQWLKSQMSRWFGKGGKYSWPVLGLLNGLLPCGMVYLALAAAVQMPGLMQSAFYMFLFGVGTFPMMLLIGLGAKYIRPQILFKAQKWYPVFGLVLGCWFILRGLSLGIPFLSPDIPSSQTSDTPVEITVCHGK